MTDKEIMHVYVAHKINFIMYMYFFPTELHVY